MSILIHKIVNCKCKFGNLRGTVVHGIGNHGEDFYAEKFPISSPLPSRERVKEPGRGRRE
jgi:hypothetical protein